MPTARRASRIAAVFWSVLLTAGVLALATSIMLPSTKRARIQFPLEDPTTATTTSTRPGTNPSSATP